MGALNLYEFYHKREKRDGLSKISGQVVNHHQPFWLPTLSQALGFNHWGPYTFILAVLRLHNFTPTSPRAAPQQALHRDNEPQKYYLL
jgi:hypothetical protein